METPLMIIQQENNSEASMEEIQNETVPQIAEVSNEIYPQVTSQSTYASMVDLHEGTELKFVPARLISGVKCAKLKKEDVIREIEYLHNAILCSVLSTNPPFEALVMEVMSRNEKGAVEVGTQKKFYITFVYGMNHEQQRHQLWEDLQSISQQTTEARCIMGDFNFVLQ
ncbi:hypothetical protein Cgig2_006433 [Carnegiea gigantea]|uniref:Uncharacterized protein n=1 Tax=Carnegiea gigantea TaxID=171969 RepID=A0A9Q1GJ13_9CARY|nr:hypothetical protein Cgig2_006433 [Carnegiea gigantea]